MSPRKKSFRTAPCSKQGLCLSAEGNPIYFCDQAPGYRDYAAPLAEQLCQRSVADHEPALHDPYKQTYVEVCHQLEETLADPFVQGNPRYLDVRFTSFGHRLRSMIEDPEMEKGDNGRYLFHIEARLLETYLGAFYYRAMKGAEAEMPQEIVDEVYNGLISILEDFDGLYKGAVTQVALKRTEIEIPALLLRSRNPEFFVFPTTFREDASESHRYNHDFYTTHANQKIRGQVKTSPYRSSRSGRGDYDENTVLTIHQDVVNLDFIDGRTVVTAVEPSSGQTEEHTEDQYAYWEYHYEEPARFVAWGALPKSDEIEEDQGFAYIQKIGGYRRDGLIDALVREARGEKLSIEEINLLNGATHYLVALLREKM